MFSFNPDLQIDGITVLFCKNFLRGVRDIYTVFGDRRRVNAVLRIVRK